LFHDDSECELFLSLYARAAHKYAWRTLAWALMLNHHHFLVSLSEGGLSEGMREVNSGYSRRLNEMYGETGRGHLVKHCFYGGHLETEGAILAAAAYIDLNPVRAGICRKPTQFAWTSYRANVGLEHPRPFHQPSELLRLLDEAPSPARAAYRRHVLETLATASDDGDEAATAFAVLESAA
jgi:putative transposase